VDFDFGSGKRVNIKWDFGVKKCIIMQFFGGKTQKVHYSAVFGDGKNQRERQKIKALNAEAQRRRVR
jgi:hypothetical protein